MAPLLSVVVPAYGVGEYLPSCLDSILASTLTDLEVIVVEDESPDESGEIADSYARHDSRVTVLHNKNQGVSMSRNCGVAAATGTYVAFADSDDLVPPRAYELMVASLEETGSDMALGNAWRYIEGEGHVPSWTHQDAFAQTRLRTHIREFPLLIRDRMVWNKVFKRSFWEREGFAFPIMLYEDYPVALAMNLRANRVDVLADKVYFWRQRLAENSITQRSLELDNFADRVKSARMLLDLVAHEPNNVRDLLNAYLIDVDIVTAATALRNSNPHDRDKFEVLAYSLAEMLTPDRIRTKPLAFEIHRTLLRHDYYRAATLAGWREEHDPRQLAQAYLNKDGIRHLPSLANSLIVQPGHVTIRDRKLVSNVVGVVPLADHDGWEIMVETRLRRMLLERATITASLVADDGTVIQPEFKIAGFAGQRVNLAVRITGEVLAQLNAPMQLRIRVALGPASWEGPVRFDGDLTPAPVSIGNIIGLCSHSSDGTGHLSVHTMAAQAWADAVIKGEQLFVHVDTVHPVVAVVRPAPSVPLMADVQDGVAVFDVADVLDDPADDPVTALAYRSVVTLSANAVDRYRHGGLVIEELVQASSPRDDGITTTAVQPLVWRHYSTQPIVHGEQQLTVEPSRMGTAQLKHQRLDHLTEL